MADAFVEACRAAGRLGIRSLALARRREPLCETTIVRRRRAGRARRAVLVGILRLFLTLFSFIDLGETTAFDLETADAFGNHIYIKLSAL